MTTLRVQYTTDGQGNVVKAFNDISGAAAGTRQQVQELTAADAKLKQEVDGVSAKKRQLSERMGQLDDAFKRGAISQAEFRRGTVAAIKDFVGFDAILRATAGAAVLAAGALVGVVGAAINNADRIDELSNRLGLSSEFLSIVGYAAKQTGSDLESVASVFPKLSRKLIEAQDPASKTAKIFKALGVEAFDPVTKQVTSLEKALPMLMDGFKRLNDPTTEQALALELLGKSGAELLEFLNLGGDGFQSMETKLRSLGGVLSDETTLKAANFKDELDNLKTAALGLGSQIAAELLPKLTETVQRLIELVNNGQLSANAVTLLSTALSAGVGTLEQYNNAVSRVQLVIEVTVGETRNWLNLLGGLASFDFSKVVSGFVGIKDAVGGAQGRLDELNAPKKPVLTPIFFTGEQTPEEKKAAAKKAEIDRLNKLIADLLGRGGSAGSKAKPQKSEEEKEAERLQRQYESLSARQRERLAQLREEIDTGQKVGLAWKVAYDIQFEGLGKLAPAKRLELLLGAEQEDQLKAQQVAQEKLTRERDRAAERAKDVLADLQEEILTLGMSNEQLEIYNNLKRAGTTANTEFGRSITAQTEILQASRQVTDALDGMRQLGYDFLVQLPKDGSAAWKTLLADLESMLLQWAAKGIIDQVFGQAGTSGKGTAGGDLFGSLFGSLFGGGGGDSAMAGGGASSFDWGGIFASLFGGGRAAGGPVDGGLYGKFYQVNEHRIPELFEFQNRQMLLMPRGMQGTVHPGGNAGGGGGAGGGRAYSPTFNFQLASPTDTRTQQQIAAKAAADSRRAFDRNS